MVGNETLGATGKQKKIKKKKKPVEVVQDGNKETEVTLADHKAGSVNYEAL
jgi:hypothetical protein